MWLGWEPLEHWLTAFGVALTVLLSRLRAASAPENGVGPR